MSLSRDENVIVVEDIVDTGRTLSYLILICSRTGDLRALKLCALLDKPERRVVEIEADYKGFEVPDEFIVGYGLDYDQKYRNLPYIGIVKFE
jgi:hypoxanthine phosphoribosyltransferase